MASGVAHSLANIFSAILGNLHFLGEELPDGPNRDLLRKLGESTYAGIDMMRSLEKFAARPAWAEMQPMDVRDVVRDVADLVRRMCIDSRACRGIRLHADLGEPCPAWGNPGQIREALINIVFNAIQALGEGGEIALVVRGEAGYACIAVRDNGPGMTKEVARRAAEPFFTTRPGVHQGLGLSVARGIIVAHRGQLTIQSAPGRGTCVNLRLPCEPPTDPRSATRVPAPEQVISEVLSGL